MKDLLETRVITNGTLYHRVRTCANCQARYMWEFYWLKSNQQVSAIVTDDITWLKMT